MITNQEVFNKVVTGLRKQGKPSIRKEGEPGPICRYRQIDGDNILKCAAGQLILDELYQKSFEGFDNESGYHIQGLSEYIGQEKLFGDTIEDINLVCELQNIHDLYAQSADFMKACEKSWIDIAKHFNLTIPPK